MTTESAACRCGHHPMAEHYASGCGWCICKVPGPAVDSAACAKAGCDKPATVEMSQPDPWCMLWKGEGTRWFCESCAVLCERVGGIRVA